MKIKITKGFHDLTLLKDGEDYEEARLSRRIWRKVGTVLEVSDKRGSEIISAGHAILLEVSKKEIVEQSKEVKEEVKTVKKTKRTRKSVK